MASKRDWQYNLLVVVVIFFSNIVHEQNTSNTNLTNKAYPGYCEHVLCWRPPEKSLSLSSWRQKDHVDYVSKRDCPAQGRTDGTITPTDVYIVLFFSCRQIASFNQSDNEIYTISSGASVEVYFYTGGYLYVYCSTILRSWFEGPCRLELA